MTLLVRLLVVIALAGGVGLGSLAVRRRVTGGSTTEGARVPDALLPGGSGGWTVLGFTSPLCVACRETPSIVAEALGVELGAVESGPVGDVSFHAADVREHPDLVEHLDVRRTPTVAVVDPTGEVVHLQDENPEPAELRAILPRASLETEASSIGRGAALSASVPRRRGAA